MLKKEFSTYLTRDLRRWKYADIDGNNLLNLEEFHMFTKPLKYAEMMDIVAIVSLLFRGVARVNILDNKLFH